MGNVFIFNPVPLWDHHLAETLDLAIDLSKKYNQIFIFDCNKKLKHCPANIYNNDRICENCLGRQAKIKSQSQFQRFKFTDLSEVDESKKHDEEIASYILENIDHDMVFIRKDAFFEMSSSSEKDLIYFSAMTLYLQVIDFIKKNSVDTVFVWNGRRIYEKMVIMAAKSLDVKVRTYISGPKIGSYVIVDDDNVFSLKHIKKNVDEITQRCMEDEEFRELVFEEGRKFFENQEKGVVDRPLGIANFSNQNNKIFDGL